MHSLPVLVGLVVLARITAAFGIPTLVFGL